MDRERVDARPADRWKDALQRAVKTGPAGQDLAADRGDDRNGRHHDQAGNQGVFEDLTALLVRDQLDTQVRKRLHDWLLTVRHLLVPAKAVRQTARSACTMRDGASSPQKCHRVKLMTGLP